MLSEGVSEGEGDELVEGLVFVWTVSAVVYAGVQGQAWHAPMAFNLHVYCTCNIRHDSAKLCNFSGNTSSGISAFSALDNGSVSSMVNKSIHKIGDMSFLPAPKSWCFLFIRLPKTTGGSGPGMGWVSKLALGITVDSKITSAFEGTS